MSGTSGSITGWLDSVRNGSDEAAKNLWDRWFDRLCDRVAPHSGRLRIHDNEDIASDAFADFFSAIKEGKFSALKNRSEIWKLLATIAVRKSAASYRFETAKRRGGGTQVQSLQDAGASPVAGARSQESDTFDLIEELIQSLDNPTLKKIVRLKIRGLSNVEISHELACSVRAVQYMVKDLEDQILNRKSFLKPL